MSDNAMLLLAPVADPESDWCLLDAFCEDEGFAFAKLEEVEWQWIQRGASTLIAAMDSAPNALPLIASAG